MKKRTSILAVLLAILLLGVGYAAVSSITLNIDSSSTATVELDDDNFDVKYDAQSTYTTSTTGGTSVVVTPTRIDDVNVSFEVTGLKKKGETVTIVYQIINDSAAEDLTANLENAYVTVSNTEYFSATITCDKSSIAVGETAKLTITLTVEKTPVDDDQTTTVSGAIDATPAN